MKDNREKINILWLRASILGSIWASSEIIIGSFLHNLRIPFSGMFLSAIAVFLLTAFDKQWRQNGIIWRAGLIAALMKSLSPSAVIFGPMIGIFCEAVLFQLSVMLLGRNIISYSIGGALAVSWSFAQMVIGLIIIYGGNIVQLYANVYKYAFKILSIQNADPGLLIILLAGLYSLFGITAALLGYSVKKNNSKDIYDLTLESNNSFQDKQNAFNKHSYYYLILALIIMIAGVSLANAMGFIYSAIYLVVFISAAWYHYGKLLRRIINPKFWIEMTLIALLSGIFLNSIQNHTYFSVSGLYAGWQMIFRAMLLSVAFNIISIELANPGIKKFFQNKRMENISNALETSFKTLPILITILTGSKNKVKRPLKLVSEYINSADQWIEYKLNNGTAKTIE